MKIYVARHGETESNKNKIVIGRTDDTLNETGRKQADNLALRLRAVKLDAVYTSPMKRSVETVQHVIKFQGSECRVIRDSRLLECDHGFMEGRSWDDTEYQLWKDSLFKRMPHGESFFDIVARVYPFMDELVRTEEPNRTVLIVTHGQPCKIIETYFRDMTEEEFRSLYWDNCELKSFGSN